MAFLYDNADDIRTSKKAKGITKIRFKLCEAIL